MATVDPTAPAETLAIPRHVRNLNALAERAGMTVTMRTASVRDVDQPEPNLMARWEGTIQQLAATGLLVPHMMRRIQWARASLGRASGGRCRLSSSSGDLVGEACVNGDRVSWDIYWGPILYSIEQRGDVEVITYSWGEIVYHGSAAALEAAGIPRKHLPTGKHTGKSRYGIVEGPEPDWSARRQPDGLYVYRRESEGAVRNRCEVEAERQRRREAQQEGTREHVPLPATAAEWKSRSCASIPLIAGAKTMLDILRAADERFRFDPADVERLSAIVMTSVSEIEAAVSALRVIDTQAPRPAMRLIWSAQRPVR